MHSDRVPDTSAPFQNVFVSITAQHSKRVFVREVESGNPITYGELTDQVSDIAEKLHAYGILPGASVGLILQNSADFFLISLALMKIDCQLFVFHPDWTKATIARQMEELPCSHYIVSDGLCNNIDPVVFKKANVTVLIPRDVGHEGFESLMAGSRPSAETSDACIHLATSGTTGLSKWVPKDFREIRYNMEAWARHIEMDHTDTVHAVLPLCTANGYYITFMMPFLAGAAIVLDRRFTPLSIAGYLNNAAEYGSTILSTVPTILYLINKLATDRQCEEFRQTSSVRFSICGTAPLDFEQKRTFENRLGLPVYFNYGITETLFVSSQNKHHTGDTDAGPLLEGMSIEVLSDGELVVKGKYPFRDYHGGRQGGVSEDGRFYTGDAGHIKDGRVYVTGRKKQMVIKGGFNIYPAEIDYFIIREPCVLDTFTFGVPNEILGEQLCSTVVLRQGISRVDAQRKILAHLKAHLPSYKIPVLYPVDEIIKTPTGKPIKEEMIKAIEHRPNRSPGNEEGR